MHVGIDEAGKGPVLGSMFVAAVRIDPDAIPVTCVDSKQLTPETREELDELIRSECVEASLAEIPVDRIDDPETNMNELTLWGHKRALQGVSHAGATCYADAADTDANRFRRRLEQAWDGSGPVVAAHGADEDYPVVGAASILAKVARDAHVEDLAAEYGPVGSGYPGDDHTRSFLAEFVAEHGRLPDCARCSWQTSKDVLASAGQATLGEF